MNSKISDYAAKESGLGKSDIETLLAVANKAASIGGDILIKNYGQLDYIKSKGRVGDLVTNTDLESEKVIVDYLLNETPNLSIVTEENGEIQRKNDLCWCIDPLDGTTNYAHGYPFFATSIGLTWKGKPILGSINVPFIKEEYYGAPFLGSFCNGKKIQVSTKKELKDSLLVTGFAYDRFTRLDNNYAEFCWMTHRTRGVRRGGAAAVDLAFVASGRLDGYWERGLSSWDLAAGVAIVEQAGGTVSDYKGASFDINTGRIIASSKVIHPKIVEELKKVKHLNGSDYGASELKYLGS